MAGQVVREMFTKSHIEDYLRSEECRVHADGKTFNFEDINIDDTIVFGLDDAGVMYDIPVQYIEYVEYEAC